MKEIERRESDRELSLLFMGRALGPAGADAYHGLGDGHGAGQDVAMRKLAWVEPGSDSLSKCDGLVS